MPYYKDSNNALHFLETTAFEYVLPADCVAISEEEANSIIEKNRVETKPSQLTARQFRWATTRLNLRDAVETAVSSGSIDLKDWYEYELILSRGDASLAELAAILNFSEQQLDEIFKLGSTL